MNKQPTFSYLWPTLFGTFYNPDHENMKKDLLKFFEEYKKKTHQEKVEKIINFMKVIMIYTHNKELLFKNF